MKAALTPRTKAVIAVHLFGNVAPVAEIEALGVPVLEDTAQAAGSRAAGGRPGGLGTIGTFSFYPSKNLGAAGDGGAIATGDSALAERVRLLAFHGSRDKVTHEEVGYNSRLDELQAAVLRVALPHLDDWSEHRSAAGDRYREELAGIVHTPRATAGSVPAWNLYVVRHDAPQRLIDGLAARQIGARSYYRTPAHRQPAFAIDADLPGTEEAARTHVAIPISATITPEQVTTVCAAVRDALLD